MRKAKVKINYLSALKEFLKAWKREIRNKTARKIKKESLEMSTIHRTIWLELHISQNTAAMSLGKDIGTLFSSKGYV